jgi:hypothetical protein
VAKRNVVYVAGPISRGNLVENIRHAHEAGMALLKAGLSPIVPHSNCFWGNLTKGGYHLPSAFVPEILPAGTTHEDWYGADAELVRRSDAVLRLPGESVGADGEVALARMIGLLVFKTVEDVIAWANSGGAQS